MYVTNYDANIRSSFGSKLVQFNLFNSYFTLASSIIPARIQSILKMMEAIGILDNNHLPSNMEMNLVDVWKSQHT